MRSRRTFIPSGNGRSFLRSSSRGEVEENISVQVFAATHVPAGLARSSLTSMKTAIPAY